MDVSATSANQVFGISRCVSSAIAMATPRFAMRKRANVLIAKTLLPALIAIGASKDSTEIHCWAVKSDVVPVTVPTRLPRDTHMPINAFGMDEIRTWFATAKKAMPGLGATCALTITLVILRNRVAHARSVIAMAMWILADQEIVTRTLESVCSVYIIRLDLVVRIARMTSMAMLSPRNVDVSNATLDICI